MTQLCLLFLAVSWSSHAWWSSARAMQAGHTVSEDSIFNNVPSAQETPYGVASTLWSDSTFRRETSMSNGFLPQDEAMLKCCVAAVHLILRHFETQGQ
ncbi:hypothetical protein CC80DRAFT_81635 [Byssothecium circinans]|uniref:Secreted protein n=1 Tax=Byssothecium circinans TaxID=147558 RepID=A0A6A5TW72_9PLEO|nr:hypothetical protein CC80DRAFT_81635 [Byssothecium circinans]